MAATVLFELVSPEKMLLAREVEMVVIPGTEGNFGVLPGHSLLIASVRPGTIEIYEGMTVVERIFTAGGFAEVTPERCTMLADEAILVTELDRAKAEAEFAQFQGEVNSARAALAEGGDAGARRLKAAERHLAIAQAKLDLLGVAAHNRADRLDA
jgi:F-type H+-transporting ATPase subunit epsilon